MMFFFYFSGYSKDMFTSGSGRTMLCAKIIKLFCYNAYLSHLCRRDVVNDIIFFYTSGNCKYMPSYVQSEVLIYY
jgi:hypothetical protein